MEPPSSILGFGYLHLFQELFLSWSTKVNNKDCLSTYNISGMAATIRTKDTSGGYLVIIHFIIEKEERSMVSRLGPNCSFHAHCPGNWCHFYQSPPLHPWRRSVAAISIIPDYA
jgi:hypothetical protein